MTFCFEQSRFHFGQLETPFTRSTHSRLRSQTPLHLRKYCLRTTKTSQQPNNIHTGSGVGAVTVVCFAFLGGLHVGALENCGPGNGALPRNCVSRCCCCCVVVVVVVVVVVRTLCICDVSVHATQRMHLIGWQNTWGASSRRPRHPFPALMGGRNPWPCTCVHGP